jgi:hypothetical protein
MASSEMEFGLEKDLCHYVCFMQCLITDTHYLGSVHEFLL